jgi:hypothetical protein
VSARLLTVGQQKRREYLEAFLDALDRGPTERVGLHESHVRDRRMGGVQLADCMQASPDPLGPLIGSEVGGSADSRALPEGLFVQGQERTTLISEVLVEDVSIELRAGADGRIQ